MDAVSVLMPRMHTYTDGGTIAMISTIRLLSAIPRQCPADTHSDAGSIINMPLLTPRASFQTGCGSPVRL